MAFLWRSVPFQRSMTLETILRWVGGILQIGGVITVALNVRSTRVILGQDSAWHRAKQWSITQWRRLTRQSTVIEATPADAVAGGSSVDVLVSSQGTVSHPDIEEQVKQLRRDVDRLREELRELKDRLTNDLQEARRHLEERVTGLNQSIGVLEDKVENLTGGNLRWQTIGVVLFLFGIAIQTFAPELDSLFTGS